MRHLNILRPFSVHLYPNLRLCNLFHNLFCSRHLILLLDHFLVLFVLLNSDTFSQRGWIFKIALFCNLLYCGGIRVSILLGFALFLRCTGTCFSLFLNRLLGFLFHGYLKLGPLRRGFYYCILYRGFYLNRRKRFLFCNKLQLLFTSTYLLLYFIQIIHNHLIFIFCFLEITRQTFNWIFLWRTIWFCNLYFRCHRFSFNLWILRNLFRWYRCNLLHRFLLNWCHRLHLEKWCNNKRSWSIRFIGSNNNLLLFKKLFCSSFCYWRRAFFSSLSLICSSFCLFCSSLALLISFMTSSVLSQNTALRASSSAKFSSIRVLSVAYHL